MQTLTIRQLEDETFEGLQAQAEANGRSVEDEVRSILTAAVHSRKWWPEWVKATEPFRGEPLAIPPRSKPREVELP